MADDRLLSGCVPQPADWLRTWAVSRDPRSWEAAVRGNGTEHYIAPMRARPVFQKSLKGMCRVMGEALRDKKRDMLQKAEYVSLGFDDKGERKLVMFKGDSETGGSEEEVLARVAAEVRKSLSLEHRDAVPDAPASCSDALAPPESNPDAGPRGAPASCSDALAPGSSMWLPYGAHMGMVGVMRSGKKDLEEFEDDYAVRTAREVIRLLRSLCTPSGDPEAGNALFAQVCAKVRVMAVDGALLKTGQVLIRDYFHNGILILRDPAHVVRTSCQDPLQEAEQFKEQDRRLFRDRHALLKDIMYCLWVTKG
jgi:hypothetical protein